MRRKDKGWKKFQAEWWTTDIKPKGKMKKYCKKVSRQDAKKQIKEELKCV